MKPRKQDHQRAIRSAPDRAQPVVLYQHARETQDFNAVTAELPLVSPKQ